MLPKSPRVSSLPEVSTLRRPFNPAAGFRGKFCLVKNHHIPEWLGGQQTLHYCVNSVNRTKGQETALLGLSSLRHSETCAVRHRKCMASLGYTSLMERMLCRQPWYKGLLYFTEGVVWASISSFSCEKVISVVLSLSCLPPR